MRTPSSASNGGRTTHERPKIDTEEIRPLFRKNGPDPFLGRDFAEHGAAPDHPALRGGVVPFNLPGIHPHDVAQVLDRFGIAVRAGHHCTMPLHERLDLAATARASFNVYSTREDVDALVTGLKEVQRVFNG